MQEEGTIKELENNALIKLISDVNIFDEILSEVSIEEILKKKENAILKRNMAIKEVISLNGLIEAYNKQLKAKNKLLFYDLNILDGVRTNLEFKELW